MRYPTLTYSQAEEIARQRLDGLDPAVDQDVKWLGTGDEVQLVELRELGQSLARKVHEWTDPDRDRFEGLVAGGLYSALQHVPPAILDDAGFWRFLAIKYFWDFIRWREEKPFADGNYAKYVSSVRSTESVLPRMYLRAQALGGSEGCNELGGAVTRGTDFWRSHVLRVRTGTSAPLARAFARKQAAERLNTSAIRIVAKRLNRIWTNVVLNLYDEVDAAEIIEAVWIREDSDA